MTESILIAFNKHTRDEGWYFISYALQVITLASAFNVIKIKMKTYLL